MLTLALVSLALLGYTFVGYPLVVWLWATVAPRPIQRGDGKPTVSVLLPVHAGADSVLAKLESLVAQDYPAHKLQILVYLDGPDPAAEAQVRAVMARDTRVGLTIGEHRAGKPTGLNRLHAAATGDVLVLTDVRQPLAPGATRALVAVLEDPAVACVSGHRVVSTRLGAGMYWRYEQWIRRHEALATSMIGATGPLYALRHRDWQPIPADIVLDDVYLPMQVRMATRGRLVLADDARVEDVDFGDRRELDRKIRALAGNYQLLARLPALWLPWRNPSWFATLSHRILRLLAPWMLVCLGVATTALVLDPPIHTVTWVLAGGQALVYGGAVAGDLIGAPGRLLRSFVLMNAAAVWGLVRYARGRLTVLW